nr:protein bric-a-brac 1-like isoform X3 [Procambarus clarkii]XP_045597604.1 protein bric-a-brac 1-like isoform X3 [Procambarus clarkii]XP_045597605.1 protein bric-a-brac 1-like isoform X3 [Procambarus clarkii]
MASKHKLGVSVKASTQVKRTRKALNIEDKLNLISDRDSGISVTVVAQKYGIGDQTVRDIYKRKTELMHYANSLDNSLGLKFRKNIKKCSNIIPYNYEQQNRMHVKTASDISIIGKNKHPHLQIIGVSSFNKSLDWWMTQRKTQGLFRREGTEEIASLTSPEVKFEETTTKDSEYGLPAPEDRGSSDFVHNNADEVPVAVSPEHFLAETSEREPTPTPPTPTPQKPESYQLRHNNHLTIVLEALARDESFMDVTLTAQGRSLKAHKSVLSAVSPYFRGVLRDNPCQHPIIIMPRDVRFEELFSIVNYIYKGEMTVAAEDLTSLLKTAEILQVSGLAPSDSSATVNPHTDCSATGNARSSSASSSSSSSNLPSVSRTSRLVKTPTHQMATPPARPKSRDSMINPTDFMDVDMTCVKEEVESADDEENEEQISKESSLQTPGNVGKGDQALQQSLSAFSPSHDAGLEQPIASTSSTHDTAPSPLPIKSDPETDINSQANLTTEDPHPFVCPHCQEHHRDRETMITHLRVRHPTKPSFTCGCGRVYTRQMHHQAHVRVCSSSP